MLPRDAANTFYQAMNSRDSVTMNAFYAPNATFSDPVFPLFSGADIQTMWSMLMRGAQKSKSLSNSYSPRYLIPVYVLGGHVS